MGLAAFCFGIFAAKKEQYGQEEMTPEQMQAFIEAAQLVWLWLGASDRMVR